MLNPAWFGAGPKIYVSGPLTLFYGDPDESDRHSCPLLPLMGMVGGQDIIVLPGDTITKGCVDFMTPYLQLEDWQVVYTEGRSYDLYQEALEYVHVIKERMSGYERRSGKTSWLLVPYSRNSTADMLGALLGASIFGSGPLLREFYGKRGIHPPFGVSQTLVPTFSEFGILVPKGFLVSRPEDVGPAVAKLRADGVEDFVMKPLYGNGGRGVQDFNLADVEGVQEDEELRNGRPLIIEEKIQAHLDRHENPITPSIHWIGDNIGPLCGQYIEGAKHCGNGWESELSHKIKKRAAEIVTQYRDRAQLTQGCGGIDFVLSSDGKLVVIDPNPDRLTQAFPLGFFRQRFARKGVVISRKCHPSASLRTFMSRLRAKRIAYEPNLATADTMREGVFPGLYMAGRESMIFVCAPTWHDAEELIKRSLPLMA